jgi:membrane protease YdiL (CAAX protease family)
MLAWARRWPVVTFFALAFAFTWALLPFTRRSVGVGLVALWGPAAAAFLTAALCGSKELDDLRARVLSWRLPIRWYLLALVLPLFVSALRSGLEYLLGAEGPIHLQPVTGLGLIVFVLVAGEEIGWRGFALPRLLARFGPWIASTVIGVLWALWHLPLFQMPGMPQYGSPFGPYIGYLIALSIVMTFLAQHTAGSVTIATLFHGAVNTFGLVTPGATIIQRGWGNLLSYALAALVLGVLAWRRSGAAPAAAASGSRFLNRRR